MTSEWVAFACGGIVFGSLGVVIGLCLGHAVDAAPLGYEDANGWHAGKPPRRVLLVMAPQERDDGRRLMDEIATEYERQAVWAEFEARARR
jgi:hypothetical protein